jgi:UDP-glucose 4-epimerase
MENIDEQKKQGAGRAAMRNQKYADPNKPRCLVTGHKGYIGSRLFDKLKSSGYDTIGIDLKEGHDINSDLNGGLSGVAFHPLYYNFKPEYIFHLACIPRVAYSVEKPVETTKNNVLATTNVLNFARKVGAKRVIYSGSSSVVGDGEGPTSPYGFQKLVSELECKLYSKLYGLDTVSLRYFNVYSKDQEVDGPYATAIANWMHYIRESKTPFITGDGKQRRDMLHVSDAVSANIFAMGHKARFDGQNFDVGTGRNISLNEVKEIVQKHFPNVEFKHIEERKGDVMLTKARTAPLRKLGWKTKVSIKKGINECFANLKEK